MSDPAEEPKNLDYEAEGASVLEVHEAVRREKEIPAPTGKEPVGLPVIIIGAIVLVFGGGYFLDYSHGFSDSVYTIGDYYSPLPRPPVEGESGVVEQLNWIGQWTKDGKKAYKNCLQCHGESGSGQPGKYPPLTGSDWVDGGTKRLAAILLNGISGPFTVAGQTYGAEAMPAWNQLNDEQIAQVISYIRRTYGELPEGEDGIVTTEMIKAAREEFGGRTTQWTEAELQAIPEDGMLPGSKVDLETGQPLAQ